MAEQPKSGFYIAVALVVLALIGFAVYRSDLVAPKPVAAAGRRRRASAQNRHEGSRATGRVEPGYGESDDRQGIPFQAGREVTAGQGDGCLQAAREQHRPIRSERLGGLGTDRARQQWLQGGTGVDRR